MLLRFVESAAALPEIDRAEFVRELMRRVVDEGQSIPLRMPLFRELVFPVLHRGLRERQPHCARWLAALCQVLYRCRECMAGLAPDNTEPRLLAIALDHDPADSAARLRWIQCEAAYLHYTIHELPAGILIGTYSATPEQCLELVESLSRFREHVRLAGVESTHRTLIEHCALHYPLYREYLLAGQRQGYQAFLDAKGIEFSRFPWPYSRGIGRT